MRDPPAYRVLLQQLCNLVGMMFRDDAMRITDIGSPLAEKYFAKANDEQVIKKLRFAWKRHTPEAAEANCALVMIAEAFIDKVDTPQPAATRREER